MQIDREAVERELAAVRNQGAQAQQMLQQAANVLQQALGAEKALNAMLTILDKTDEDADVDKWVDVSALREEHREIEREIEAAVTGKPRGTSARKNGHAEGATQ